MDDAKIRPGDGTRFKELHRQIEAAVAHIERTENVADTVRTILELLLDRFTDELGFEGGRVYERRGVDFYLCCAVGSAQGTPLGLRVPRDYPPHRHLLEHGIVIRERGDPGFDEEFESRIGVGETFAAIGVGEGITHIIGFSIQGRPREDELLYSLTVVRHVINLKLQKQSFAGTLEAARIVQESMLPAQSPEFGGFDLAGRSQPAAVVSGDLFDYSRISDCCLGIAIADSSGHGLPAAMLARDVITALRMAAGEGHEVDVIVDRLNGVIHRAAVTATFVSLFYGQLSTDGTFQYCNAGHEPPLLVRRTGITTLDRGGTVLGPIRSATYERGETRLEPGDLLVLFSDGITERVNPAGDPFEVARLERLLPSLRDREATAVVDAVFADVDRFAEHAPLEDDMTVVAVRRQ